MAGPVKIVAAATGCTCAAATSSTCSCSTDFTVMIGCRMRKGNMVHLENLSLVPYTIIWPENIHLTSNTSTSTLSILAEMHCKNEFELQDCRYTAGNNLLVDQVPVDFSFLQQPIHKHRLFRFWSAGGWLIICTRRAWLLTLGEAA